MNNYKATPECWEWQEKWASKEVPDEDSSCFLELRARVEALEAQGRNYPETPDSSTPPPVATDEELRGIGDRAYDFRWRWRNVAEPAPVAGEMAELVADLRRMASQAYAACQFNDGETLTRAANTLQQLSEQEAGQ
jgi:hypothetical protein